MSSGKFVRVPELTFERPVRIVWRKSGTLSHAASAFLGVTETAAPKLGGLTLSCAIDAL